MEDSSWYVAELVVGISVAGEDRTAIHRNFVLIKAASATEAHDKANEVGRSYESSYDNPNGARVVHSFKGIAELLAVHDELEHGAELWFAESLVPNEKVAVYIPPKEELGVFRSRRPSALDYRSGEVLDAMKKLVVD